MEAAAPPGDQDRRNCAKVMLHVSKQLRSIKHRMMLRLEQGGHLDRSAKESYERLGAARGAAPNKSYLKPRDKPHEALGLELERLVLAALLEPTVSLPMLVGSLQNKLLTGKSADRFQRLMEQLKLQDVEPVALQLAFGPARCLELLDAQVNGRTHLYVVRVDDEAAARHSGIRVDRAGPSGAPGSSPWSRNVGAAPLQQAAASGSRQWLPRIPDFPEGARRPPAWEPSPQDTKRRRQEEEREAAASAAAAAQLRQQSSGREDGGQVLISELLDTLSTREAMRKREFQVEGAGRVRVPCPHLTREACCKARKAAAPCGELHYKVMMRPETDPKLGNCTWLHACHRFRCPYLHYELDREGEGGALATAGDGQGGPGKTVAKYMQNLGRPQWVNADARTFDFSVLGKFDVIMADPPWDINQGLPYGLLADDEMQHLDFSMLQDNGVMFLWVTARCWELGRQMLERWGYTRVDELVWIKVNQLCQLNRGGRTGHYLNHSKEHCLVAVKGNPAWDYQRRLDCDVLVAPIRETSRKPDEMYLMLERLCPGGRKLELFARGHNLRPGWVSLGNQLPPTLLTDDESRARFQQRYGVWPNG